MRLRLAEGTGIGGLAFVGGGGVLANVSQATSVTSIFAHILIVAGVVCCGLYIRRVDVGRQVLTACAAAGWSRGDFSKDEGKDLEQ